MKTWSGTAISIIDLTQSWDFVTRIEWFNRVFFHDLFLDLVAPLLHKQLSLRLSCLTHRKWRDSTAPRKPLWLLLLWNRVNQLKCRITIEMHPSSDYTWLVWSIFVVLTEDMWPWVFEVNWTSQNDLVSLTRPQVARIDHDGVESGELAADRHSWVCVKKCSTVDLTFCHRWLNRTELPACMINVPWRLRGKVYKWTTGWTSSILFVSHPEEQRVIVGECILHIWVLVEVAA